MTGKYQERILLVAGIVMLMTGISFMLFREVVLNSFFYLWGLSIIFSSITTMVKLPFRWLNSRNRVPHINLVQLFLRLMLGLFLLVYHDRTTHWIAIMITLYLFILGIIHLIDYLLLQMNRQTGRLRALLSAIAHMLFGIGAVLDITTSVIDVYFIMGVYLIFLGITDIVDSRLFLSRETKSEKRVRRISLPVILTAIIPVRILNRLNDFLSDEKSQVIEVGYKETGNEIPDLEVWIHTARQGFEMVGHADISYEGITYSYGQYDVDTSRLGGMIGDGVLWTIPSDQYREALAKDDWRAVFAYGMKLTDEQKEAVKQQITNLMSITVPFELTSPTQKESYLGQLSQQYDVSAYKFTKSRFKTYFVMTTNCVLLADEILARTGIDQLGAGGIITPGAYQIYFEKEYHRPHSAVITRTVQGKKYTQPDMRL